MCGYDYGWVLVCGYGCVGIAMGVGICEYWCVHGHGYGCVGMDVYEYWFSGYGYGCTSIGV